MNRHHMQGAVQLAFGRLQRLLGALVRSRRQHGLGLWRELDGRTSWLLGDAHELFKGARREH